MENGLERGSEAAAVQKDHLYALTSSPQWGMLRAFIEDQIRQKLREVMAKPVTTMQDAQRHNYLMGECAFGQILIEFVEANFQVTKETVELYKQALSERGEDN